MRGSGQVGEVSVLNPDQIRLVKGEVEMEFDQPGECGRGVPGSVHNGVPAGHQPGAHPDQQFDQQRLFVGEVPVDGGPADAGRRADVLQAHGQEAPLGDQLLSSGEQL